MKSKIMKIKSLFASNGFSRNNLILSVVALVEIIAIMVVSTSAWVETISTVQISSSSGSIATPIYTTAKFDGTDNEIDLSEYFNESGNVHLSSASSADGNNMFFPKIGSEPVNYRKGTINDINVNYISFTIQIESAKTANEFYFKQNPSISIGGNPITDSAIRIAVSKDGETPKIFSNSETADKAVISEDGTKADTTVNLFSSYVGSDADEPIFDIAYKETSEVTFTLWLEDPIMSSSYTGQNVTVDNFILITAEQQYQLTFVDRTTAFNDDTDATTNGLYWVQNDNARLWAYDAASGECIEMTKSDSDSTKWTANITQDFITNQNSNLYFLRTSSSTTNPDPNDSTTYYNKWTTKLASDTSGGKTFTAYSNIADSDDKLGTWGEVVEITLDSEDSASLAKPAVDNNAAHVTLKVSSVNYEMNYKTVDSVSVWRCYMPVESSKGSITFSFTNSGTSYTYNAGTRGDSLKYVITSSNTGYWNPPVTIKVISNDTAAGTVSVSGGKSGATEVKVTPGTEVTLSAVSTSDDYGFVGWYTNSEMTAAATLTDGNKFTANESKTFYAKFQRQYHIQLTAVTGTTTQDTTGGTVQFNSETATGKVDKYLFENGTDNKNVKFTAAVNSDDGYEFLGWYTNASGTGTVYDSNLSIDIETVSQNYTLYAIFKLKEFSVTAVATPTADDDESQVTFDVPTGAGTGTRVTVTVKYNNSATFRAIPDTAHGYEFEGWYTDEACTQKVTGAGATYTVTNIKSEGLILYAKFKLMDVTVTANAVTGTNSPDSTGGTVKISGGTASAAGATDSKTVTYGNPVTLTAAVKDGYNFVGWYDSATGGSALSSTVLSDGGKYTDATITLAGVKAETTVYARFEQDGVTIYFKPNDGWKEANARFAAYMWNGSDNAWYDLTGPDSNGCYSFTCTNGWTNIIFARMNPNTTENNFNNDVRWNQTGDLTFSASTPCYVVTDFSSGNTTGKWTTYPPEDETTVTITFDSTNVDWVDDSGAAIYLYDRSNKVYYKMTVSGTLKWTVTVPESVTYISFYRCNGSWGSGDKTDSVTTYWNKWEPDGRGTSTTYKTSGDGSGNWQ